MKVVENAKAVLENRYLSKDESGQIIETPEAMLKRVAKHVASAEKDKDKKEWEDKFFKLMDSCRFLPNTPTLMNSGKKLGLLSACFVLDLPDSIVGIMKCATDIAMIQKNGGGTGISLDKLRPRGSRVMSSNGTTSGSISFLQMLSAVTDAIQQGAHRRGAGMAMMSWDHPDIISFIHCKAYDINKLTNYNISVKVSDEFMESAKKNSGDPLIVHNKHLNIKYYVPKSVVPNEYGTQDLLPVENGEPQVPVWTCTELFETICQLSWKNGEPGLSFIDEVNRKRYDKSGPKIECTNPCVVGETLVGVADGRNAVSIKQLAEEVKDVPVYCYGDGQIQIRTGRNPRKTRKQVEVWKVVLDDGTYIIATPDHKFRLKEGFKEVKLKELKSGDSLMPFNRKECLVESVGHYGNEDVYNITVDDYHTVAYITEKFGNTTISKVEDSGQKFIKSSGTGVVSSQCGEQGLLPYSSCNLGSIDLAKYYKKEAHLKEENIKIMENYKIEVDNFDFEMFREDIHTSIRFLDNIIDVNKYPVPEIEVETKRTRNIGLGVMGLANLFFEMEIKYGSEESFKITDGLAKFFCTESDKASEELVSIHGRKEWKKGKKYRNSCTTTVAPTGTISILANTSGGIEPLFSLYFERHIMEQVLPEFNPFFEKKMKEHRLSVAQMMEVFSDLKLKGHLPEWFPKRDIYVTAHEVTPEQHVRMQAVWQTWIGNSISKTINLNNDAEVSDVRKSYILAYNLKCKGVTVFRDGSRGESQPMKLNSGVVIGTKEDKLIPVGNKLLGVKFTRETSYGKVHVMIIEQNGEPVELFINISKSGAEISAVNEALGRSISIGLRHGMPIEAYVHQLCGIKMGTPVMGPNGSLSVPDAIGECIKTYLSDSKGFEDIDKGNQNTGNFCPDCHSALNYTEGCRGGKCSNPKCSFMTCS